MYGFAIRNAWKFIQIKKKLLKINSTLMRNNFLINFNKYNDLVLFKINKKKICFYIINNYEIISLRFSLRISDLTPYDY